MKMDKNIEKDMDCANCKYNDNTTDNCPFLHVWFHPFNFSLDLIDKLSKFIKDNLKCKKFEERKKE